MKLPVITVQSLPNLFKHCSNVDLVHIDMKLDNTPLDQTFIEDYLRYIREQIYQAIEANFVTSQASRITSHKETFVIFKSNVEKTILHGFVEAMLAELDMYLEGSVTLSYQFMSAMLFLEGSSIPMFRSAKLGDDIMQSPLYEKYTIVYDHKKKPRGKQLISPEEYRPLYEKMNSRKAVSVKSSPIAHSSPTSVQTEEPACICECEYYI